MSDLPIIPGRRVIQITAIPEALQHSYGVFALCADGTIWEAFYFFGNKEKNEPPRWGDWEQVPPLPESMVRIGGGR